MPTTTWDSATINEATPGSGILSNGDLSYHSTTYQCAIKSTTYHDSGKWYCEITATNVTAASSTSPTIGVCYDCSGSGGNMGGTSGYGNMGYRADGYISAGGITAVASYTTGDIIGIAVDLDGDTVKFYKNGILQNTQALYTNISNSTLGAPPERRWIGAQVYGNTEKVTANFGATSFIYNPPAGYKSWDESYVNDGTDPYYDAVAFLANLNEPVGSTTFIDLKGHTIVTKFDAVSSNAQSYFGTTSAYFDGAGDNLYVDADTDFGMSGTDFTIEFCYYQPYPISTQKRILESMDLTSAKYYQFYPYDSGGVLKCTCNLGAAAATFDLLYDAWNYVQVSCKYLNSTVYPTHDMYIGVNGVPVLKTNRGLIDHNNPVLSIGGSYNAISTSNTSLNGYVNFVRLTRAFRPLYGSDTLPTDPYIPVAPPGIFRRAKQVSHSKTQTIMRLQ